MYYTNITNPELQQFHKVIVPNFTIKLTDILTSDLFKVDTVISGSIYKVYPLFYTNEITSSNSNDRVLDNQCIICEKLDTETYLTFISDVGGEIRDYSNYASYFEVGDSLTTAEFNSIVSLLRHNVVNVDGIRINDSVNGVYGVYEFDISDTTILDNGIVVSDETISAEPKVRLSNPTFPNSTYTLKLQVLHFTDVNILDDDSDDYKVIETVSVDLVAGEWVDIPVTDLSEGYVILFDANVEIRHDKSIIQDWVTQLFLTGDKPIIQTGDSEILTATALDDLGNGVDGVNIDFVQKSKQLYVDKGTSSSHQTWNNETGFSRTDTATTITASTSTFVRIPTSINGDFTITFKGYVSNGVRITIYNASDVSKRNYAPLTSTTEKEYRVTRVGGNITFEEKNGDNWTTLSVTKDNDGLTTENAYFGFIIATSTSRSVTFRDIKVVRNNVQIGSALTDETSTATISYTGVGQGDVDFKAKYQSIETSEIPILDALFLDTHTNHNTKWWASHSSASISADTDGVIFSSENVASTTYSRNLAYITNSFPEGWSERENACKFITSLFCFEFDIVDVYNSDRVIVNFTGGAKHIGNISNGDHIKIEYDGSQLTIYNGSQVYDRVPVTFTDNKTWMGFQIYGGYKLKLDNILIYPI